MNLLQRDTTSREICKLCYHVNPVGFNVPNDVWLAVVPDHVKSSVVCLSCFTRLGDEKGIPWDHEIDLYPVSLATHLGIDRAIRHKKEILLASNC
ncbi:hypothetical protein RAS2_16980 [Phycisphaerae bacterium RAS2]|nr:hypothetical protein RAS2_16980 [Phycisphaerae bacterium RAS2]